MHVRFTEALNRLSPCSLVAGYRIYTQEEGEGEGKAEGEREEEKKEKAEAKEKLRREIAKKTVSKIWTRKRTRYASFGFGEGEYQKRLCIIRR